MSDIISFVVYGVILIGLPLLFFYLRAKSAERNNARNNALASAVAALGARARAAHA